MANLFFTSEGPGGLYKISTDADKASMGINDNDYTVKVISDSDFQSVRNNTKVAVLSGDTVSYTDVETSFNNAEGLTMYLNQVKSTIDSFIQGRPSNSMITALTNYRDYIDSFDVSSLTYSLDKSWEKYCEDNSITYFHPLQIP